MTCFRPLAMVFAAALMLATPVHARIQKQMYCWVSDVEFPVACDEEGEDDDDEGEMRAAGSDPWASAAEVYLPRWPGI